MAARYDSEGTLQLAQGFERRGEVWSDLRLFDRGTLVERLRARRRVAVGSPTPIPGDYYVLANVTLHQTNGKVTLGAGSAPADRDSLAVPVF